MVRRMRGFLLATLCWAGLVASPLNAQPVTPPYEMVRTLQSLQAQVAQGNSQALAAQRALLLRMENDFMDAPAVVWQDPRNARAAVIHLLSGGHPAVMRELMKFDPLPSIDVDLMNGALAYVEGREQQAAELLSGFDPRELPPSLGGHVALALAAVTVREKPEAALTYLGLARLLLPGSLVEEAALRREVFVAGTLDNIERFQSLSITYLRRFRNSIYAPDFRRRFMLAIDTLGFAKSPEKFALIESLFNEFDEDTQRTLYLRMARTALLHGQLEIVRKVVDRAIPLAMGGTREEAMLKIYMAGATMDAKNIKLVRDTLWSVDKTLLEPDELDLLDAVYSVMNSVRHWPEPPVNVIGEFSSFTPGNKPGDPEWITPVMSHANQLLTETGKLLDKAGNP